MVNFLWENILKRASHEKNVTAFLRDNYLFQDLSKRELRFVENIVHIRHYHAGETIFRQGEVGIGMYMIVKGSVDIIVSDTTANDPDSTKDVFVTRLSLSDFFGELSLVENNGLRSATARAHEDTMLIGFFRPDLMEMLERSPSTGVKVLFRLAEVLGKRLKETTDKISQLRRELRLVRHQRISRTEELKLENRTSDEAQASKPTST